MIVKKDRTMQIIHITMLDTISPVYYERTYHAIPVAGADSIK
jgi:non-homologous end joining protein Ku